MKVNIALREMLFFHMKHFVINADKNTPNLGYFLFNHKHYLCKHNHLSAFHQMCYMADTFFLYIYIHVLNRQCQMGRLIPSCKSVECVMFQ